MFLCFHLFEGIGHCPLDSFVLSFLQVFSSHCPFLMGPIECLKEFVTPDTDIKVWESAKWNLIRIFLLLKMDGARVL